MTNNRPTWQSQAISSPGYAMSWPPLSDNRRIIGLFRATESARNHNDFSVLLLDSFSVEIFGETRVAQFLHAQQSVAHTRRSAEMLSDDSRNDVTFALLPG